MTLKNQAIQTAMEGNWTEAVSYNKQLLEENPNDIETLNRLAFAFHILGNIHDAKKIYEKVLKLDRQNPIALKNLKRLLEFGNSNKTKKGQTETSFLNNNFIEETGKTKVIELINVAEAKRIAHLLTGESLILSIKRLKIFIIDRDNNYIGMLPDDVGKRLIKFLKGGNKYQAFVKSVGNHGVNVFIKETIRASRFKNQQSFAPGDKSKSAIYGKSYHLKEDSDSEEERD